MVVKSLLTKGENEVREFCAEMEMFARMDHPNVVKLIGVCREQEPHFLITEYCDWVRQAYHCLFAASQLAFFSSLKNTLKHFIFISSTFYLFGFSFSRFIFCLLCSLNLFGTGIFFLCVQHHYVLASFLIHITV